jgi:hypothetical protein
MAACVKKPVASFSGYAKKTMQVALVNTGTPRNQLRHFPATQKTTQVAPVTSCERQQAVAWLTCTKEKYF